MWSGPARRKFRGMNALFQTAPHWAARVRTDDGQALLEYTLILMLVALVTFVTLGAVGTAVDGLIAPVLNGL